MAKKKAKKTTNETEVVDIETLKGSSTKPTVTPIKPPEKMVAKVEEEEEEEEEELLPTAEIIEEPKRVYIIDDNGKPVELVNKKGEALSRTNPSGTTKVWVLIDSIRKRRDAKTPTPQDAATYKYLKSLELQDVIDQPLDKGGFNELLTDKGFNNPTSQDRERRRREWQAYNRQFERSDPTRPALIGTYTYVQPAVIAEPLATAASGLDASGREELPSPSRGVSLSDSEEEDIILNDKQRLDAIKLANEGGEGEPFVAVSETGTVITSEEPAYKRIAKQNVNLIVQDSTKGSELSDSLIEKVKMSVPRIYTSDTGDYKDNLLKRLEDKINPPTGASASSNPVVEALEELEELEAEELIEVAAEPLDDDEAVPVTTASAAASTTAEGDLPVPEDDPVTTATAPYAPPSDAGSPIAITNINVKRYHPKSLLFFFGSKDIPDWDSELYKEVMKASYEKGELVRYMNTIVEGYGDKIFVYKRLSETKEEFNELIQLQFCVMRNLNRGNRFRSVTLKADDWDKLKEATKASQTGPKIVAPGLAPAPSAPLLGAGSSSRPDVSASASMGPVTTVNRPTPRAVSASSGAPTSVKEAEKNFQNVFNTSKVSFDGRRIEPTKPLPVKKNEDPLSTLTSNRPLMTPSQIGAPKLTIKRKQ